LVFARLRDPDAQSDRWLRDVAGLQSAMNDARRVRAGATHEEILADYSYLEAEDIAAVLEFAAILECATVDEAVTRIAFALKGRRMLLIVDDVWDAGHGALLLRALPDSCRMIITTRLTGVSDQLATDDRLSYLLPVLDEQAAVRLMVAGGRCATRPSRGLCQSRKRS
jgi:hypothetical protein